MFGKLWATLRPSGQPDSPLKGDRLLRTPIDSPMVLDQLWAEFTGSGNAAAVRRIVSVLDWEDLVRRRLQRWLSETRPEVWMSAPYKGYRELLIRCQFPINFERRLIDASVDLDLHVAISARNGTLKFAELPIPLSTQELLRLAMKSAAVWSLLSMADQHDVVAKVCDQESKKSGGAARLLLRRRGEQ
jgi:hypothetical protein